ncbi:hypothetical protein BCR33DRAFT_435286 [Rhizoclosmatium globosum]|uniref:Uncharacterized protein n=1 Tax=Rhizoclosmatium globosum TaxID=329046 RepID=A0A1Y2BU29_9FUNG|nr:hypothetical protein BCR33DRAFT_435286 [Rhizoclosmatium globosum]|eukprot:ORY38243.1 hypothetical protein BCR33DRAFT_435286 [Rhizoclosmatium globosum]
MIAAVRSLASSNKTLDTSLLLITPSLALMHKLLYLAPKYYNSSHTDEPLYAEVFHTSPCRNWTRLPTSFNLQNIHDAKRLSHAVTVQQHSFWNSPAPIQGTPLTSLYREWTESIEALFHTQMQQQGFSDVNLVPKDHTSFHLMLRANTWTARFVIYSLLTQWTDRDQPIRVVSNRERYCALYPGTCFHYLQTKSDASIQFGRKRMIQNFSGRV